MFDPFVVTVLAAAAVVHGLAGFAFALVSLPLLSLHMDLRSAVPLTALYGLLINACLLFPMRKHFRLEGIRTLLIGAVAGVPIGVFFLSKAPESWLRGMLGATLVLYGLWGLLRPEVERHLSDRWGYPFGVAAGALGAAFNTSGPPVVVYISLKGWSKHQTKSSFQGFFLILVILVVASYAAGGLVTRQTLGTFLVSSPFVLAGLLVGHRLYLRLSPTLYIRLIHLLLIGSGIMLWVRV